MLIGLIVFLTGLNVVWGTAMNLRGAAWASVVLAVLTLASGSMCIRWGWQIANGRVRLLGEPRLYTGSENAKSKDEAAAAFMRGDCRLLIVSLRSGAGLDGLQSRCRTVVFGELDWSPGVHEQCIGRVHRDGQPDPVMAYYLISDDGADPVIADVLGVKRGQIEGVCDPNGALIEKLETGEDNVKRLAVAYLERVGMSKPTTIVPGTVPETCNSH